MDPGASLPLLLPAPVRELCSTRRRGPWSGGGGLPALSAIAAAWDLRVAAAPAGLATGKAPDASDWNGA
jgi:hypothetical protein